MTVQVVLYTKEYLGKRFSRSKIKDTWTFNVDGRQYILNIIESIFSGRKQVILNNKILFDQNNLDGSNYKYDNYIHIRILDYDNSIEIVDTNNNNINTIQIFFTIVGRPRIIVNGISLQNIYYVYQ